VKSVMVHAVIRMSARRLAQLLHLVTPNVEMFLTTLMKFGQNFVLSEAHTPKHITVMAPYPS
jgi:hypothetical protein